MRRSIQAFSFALSLVFIASAQIPTDSLVAYYPFNGNANDLSGKGNNGTVSNVTLTADRFGNSNSAYSFNGSSSCIVLPTNLNGSLLNVSKLTISLWIYQSVVNNGTAIFNNWLGQGSIQPVPYGIIMGSNRDTIGVSLNAGQGNLFNGSLPINHWYHIIVVFDGSQNSRSSRLILYVNGVQLSMTDTAQQSIPAQLGNVASYTSIGNRNINGESKAAYFNGLIDDIRIYRRVLSINEISSLYNEGINPFALNKTGISGIPASFSVDSTFNSVVSTFNTSAFSNIDTLYLCYETSNLTYLSQRPDRPANYTVNIGGAVADFGNNISTGTFSAKKVNITALKALSANFQVTYNYTGGGGEILFANPYLLVYGAKGVTGSMQKAVLRPQSLMKASAFPNPVRTSATINYSVPSASPLDISIYSSDGKLVKNVFSGLRQAGAFNYVWDGTNLSGSAVANGNYFFRVKAANGQQVLEKVVVLK